MHNLFIQGFLKAAIAKGYTEEEATAIYKEAARGDFAMKALPWINKTNPQSYVRDIVGPQGRGGTGQRLIAGDIKYNRSNNTAPLPFRSVP